MNSDFVDLLRLLNERRVKYLIVGGYAVVHYTEPRYTKDLDLWVESSVLNGKRIIAALEIFGAPLANITYKDFATPGLVYIFGVPPLRVDLINNLKIDFKTAYRNKVVVTLDKLKVPIVDIATLIKLKQMTNRAQDKIDIKRLKRCSTQS